MLAEGARGRSTTAASKLVPESWDKTWEHWMHNIRRWCISRQLWWGHRIPAWYAEDGALLRGA